MSQLRDRRVYAENRLMAHQTASILANNLGLLGSQCRLAVDEMRAGLTCMIRAIAHPAVAIVFAPSLVCISVILLPAIVSHLRGNTCAVLRQNHRPQAVVTLQHKRTGMAIAPKERQVLPTSRFN